MLVDGPDLDRRVAEATANATILLGLDGVGGEATRSLASCLGDSAAVVCYATAQLGALVVPALQVIFRDLSIRSFWAKRWYKTASQERFVAEQKEIVRLVASGALYVPIAATYPLTAYKDALAHASKGQGRVLFKCS